MVAISLSILCLFPVSWIILCFCFVSLGVHTRRETCQWGEYHFALRFVLRILDSSKNKLLFIPLSKYIVEPNSWVPQVPRGLSCMFHGLCPFVFNPLLSYETPIYYECLSWSNRFLSLGTWLLVAWLFFVFVFVVYFILSRLLYLAFSANLGLLCMPHPGMGPLV